MADCLLPQSNSHLAQLDFNDLNQLKPQIDFNKIADWFNLNHQILQSTENMIKVTKLRDAMRNTTNRAFVRNNNAASTQDI